MAPFSNSTTTESCPPTAPRIPEVKALQGIIFVNLFAFLAVAYLAGLLVAKLRQARVKLKDTSGALEDLQILHENIIQSISSGLITTGLDGRITLVNTAAQKLLERAADQLLGKPVSGTISRSAAQRRIATGPRRSSLRHAGKLPQNGSGASGCPHRAGARSAGLRLCLR